MRVQTKTSLAYQEIGIALNKEERAALKRASQIADEAREMARKVIGSDFEDEDTDLWLAEIEHNAASFAAGGFIVISISALDRF